MITFENLWQIDESPKESSHQPIRAHFASELSPKIRYNQWIGEVARKCNDHTWIFFEISSWLRNQTYFTKQAHSSAAILIHLPINRGLILIQKHTKATILLAFSFSSLVHCFSKFFGKKNRFLQTRAYLWEVSILTSQGRSFEVIQAPGSLL